tara:strand:+ start:423 stop:1004 length:582 start_codon:yes stop_codon:yes gene_type:complete
MIAVHENWLSDFDIGQIWGETVCRPNWQFGFKSHESAETYAWCQQYYKRTPPHGFEYISVGGFKSIVMPNLGKHFIDLVGDDYVLIKNIVTGRTVFQDSGLHNDWQAADESITGIFYLNRSWEDSFGGDTIINTADNSEISKVVAGNLITFDSVNQYNEKGPEIGCTEMRCTVLLQAVRNDAWQRLVDNRTKE